MENKFKVTGEFVEIRNEEFYKISNLQSMSPFFISLASNSDIWLFASSNGPLTAGRKNADLSLFPYETEDKISSATDTGPKTIVRAADGGGGFKIWEPFANTYLKIYDFQRNIYKSTTGNTLIYEEENRSLGLVFRYQWMLSDQFGIVRSSTLVNSGKSAVNADIVDGLMNLLPYGVPLVIQQSKSCLSDAYKASEADSSTGIGLYYLTSRVDDKPLASEVLRANVVWSVSKKKPVILLSSDQLRDFCEGAQLKPEADCRGRRGNYFTAHSFNLEAGAEESWLTVADVGLSQGQIAQLREKIGRAGSAEGLLREIAEDCLKGTVELKKIVAMADGLQKTGDEEASVHHFSNVLYNVMRGGVFLDGYSFDYGEFLKFAATRDKTILRRKESFFGYIREHNSVFTLKEKALESGDPDLVRLCMEFIPLSFSRRHGDPSRPWNRFFINLKNENGKKNYNYEGNWRDIFQNWEAMGLSFPEYIENMIVKFLNASTADGFNPYRINQDGIDWEVLDTDDPWSSIGYWGDHQIVYLLKLLESLSRHDQDRLLRLMGMEVFCYADVPYEIKSYRDLIKDNKSTIDFNREKNERLQDAAEREGSDARLVRRGGKTYYVHFAEKILVPMLSKLSNLVVGGGIWMNTQRPEWNDANNAIVGNGLSMVTACHLRRHLAFCAKWFGRLNEAKVPVSREVASWFGQIGKVFRDRLPFLEKGAVNDKIRKEILDELGLAFERYRDKIYRKGFSGKSAVSIGEMVAFFNLALKYIDDTIDRNAGNDRIYQAYNIYHLSKDHEEISIQPLYHMLEGQTAALSSGKLSGKEALSAVLSMEKSDLFSREQNTFYLYPKKNLSNFMDKNIVPPQMAESSDLLQHLLKNGDPTLVMRDIEGNVRFHPDFQNVRDFTAALEKLKERTEYRMLAEKEFHQLCELYESVFRHKEFTGRSGVMYKYEGIGCVYWHQNSKFLLSLQECFYQSMEQKDDPKTQSDLKAAYYRVRQGLGFNKEPGDWGAFPFDPYSHTPYYGGAQQPGMTGQVKEEIITRQGELGISVDNGEIGFNPALLRKEEFAGKEYDFRYYDTTGNEKTLKPGADSLVFTLCQVPVVYRIAPENKIEVTRRNGTETVSSHTLGREISRSIFRRTGEVEKLTVLLTQESMNA